MNYNFDISDSNFNSIRNLNLGNKVALNENENYHHYFQYGNENESTTRCYFEDQITTLCNLKNTNINSDLNSNSYLQNFVNIQSQRSPQTESKNSETTRNRIILRSNNATFKWLENTFQFRQNVTISRSTIYELYQNFCRKSNFAPVSKATLGKIIRNQFPLVKSKRLGARGQSKYHVSFSKQYCNITFKENANIQLLSQNEIDFLIFTKSIKSIQDDLMLDENPPLSILSNRKSGNFSHNLNTNDHHVILQSMFSFIRLPQDQLINNHRCIFINLYKTYCQYLIDAALSSNFEQMRRYLIHFWQQLPRNIVIYVDLMNSLDSYMYLLLCNVYLFPGTSAENLKRINTIGHLMPQLLLKSLTNISEYHDEWILHFDLPKKYDQVMNLCEIKVEEALKWQYKIKFIVDFLASLKKIDCSLLPDSLDYLFKAFQQTIRLDITKDCCYSFFNYYKRYLLFDNIGSNDSILHERKNYCEIVWTLLVEEFPRMVENLKTNLQNQSWMNQMMIDEIDQIIKRIEYRYFSILDTKVNHKLKNNLYKSLSSVFNHLSGKINRIIAMHSIKLETISETNDRFKKDVYQDSMSDISDESFQNESIFFIQTSNVEHQVKLNTQSYLILMIINDYLMLVCQSMISKRFELDSLDSMN